MAELEDKYNRFYRYFDIDIKTIEEAALGGEGANLSNYYTKAETNALLGAIEIPNLSDYYTKAQTDSLLANKLESNDLDSLETSIADHEARIDTLESNPGGGGGVSDHGALTGLADDDHPQYLNNTRGDVRYYTKAQVDSAIEAAEPDLTGYATDSELTTGLAGKANTDHNHDNRYYTETEIDSMLGGYATDNELSTGLSGKADSVHNHDSRYYTEDETNALLADKASTTALSSGLAGKADVNHNHDSVYYTKTQIDSAMSGKANSSHTHDDRYYTEAEVDTALAGKSSTGHNHDDRYYTETEMDAALAGKASTSALTTGLAGKADTSHVHDDRYYTESETDSKLNTKDTIAKPGLWTFKQWNSQRRIEQINAICIGSSTMWGQNAGTAPENNLVNAIAHSFRSNYGTVGGRFFSPPHMSGSSVLQTNGWSNAGTGTFQDFPNGLNLHALQMGGTKSISITVPNCTGVEVYFQQGGSVGAFTVAWSGTASGSQLVTPTTDKFAARADGIWKSGVWTRGTYTITISVSSTILNFNGMYVFDGDNSAGVRFINAAYPGTQASNYSGTNSDVRFHNRFMATFDPKLLVYMVGSNDWGADVPVATYKANVKAAILQARASLPTTPSVLLMQQYQRYTATDPDPWNTFGNALKELSEELYDVDYLDISSHFPVSQAKDIYDLLDSDGYHPTVKGLQFIGQIVADHLSRRLDYNTAPSYASAPTITPDPSTLSGLVSAWRSSDLSAVQDTAVSTWSPYAGSQSTALVQATSGNQPTIQARGVAEIQTVKTALTGSKYLRSTAAWSSVLTGPLTVLMVAKLGSASNTAFGYMYHGRVSGNVCSAQANGNSQLTLGAGATTASVTAGGQRFQVYGIVYNGASSVFQTDNLPASTVAALTNGANYGLDGITLGADTAGANAIDAEYAEILIFNRALTTNELDTSIKYLARKYALDGIGRTSI